MRGGFITAGAGVLALVGAMDPAIAHAKALREVASLGVETTALEQLSEAGKRYAGQFGESATDFVRSAYDIQSAITGLSGDQLSAFTTAANITAKGTKASAEEVTGYFGTMYGIFQNQANSIGKAQWVNMLAGQTAQAVQMFKTTGPQMSAFFSNLGADAQAAGLSMSEQFAIGGTLQATMGGAEGATRFKAFLRGVGQAQDKLGLQFTDSAGKMLPVADILDKIRGKFGAIDTVAKADTLKNAFGSDEATAVVKLLLADTEGLRGNIDKLQKVKGLGPAMEMAQTMVDPFDRLKEGVRNLAITWGEKLLPVITPWVDKMSEGAEIVRGWMERFPHLTKLIGLAAVGIAGFTAVLGIMAVVGGIASLAMSPIALIVGAIILAGVAVAGLIYWWEDLMQLWEALPGWARIITKALRLAFAPVLLLVEAIKEAHGLYQRWFGDESSPEGLGTSPRAEASPLLSEAARSYNGSGEYQSARQVIFNMRVEKADHMKMERMLSFEGAG